MYIYIYLYIYIYTYIYTHTHTHVHLYICTVPEVRIIAISFCKAGRSVDLEIGSFLIATDMCGFFLLDARYIVPIPPCEYVYIRVHIFLIYMLHCYGFVLHCYGHVRVFPIGRQVYRTHTSLRTCICMCGYIPYIYICIATELCRGFPVGRQVYRTQSSLRTCICTCT